MRETEGKKNEVDREVLKRIEEAISQIQFGSVTIVVHEGKVVQLDTNVRERFN